MLHIFLNVNVISYENNNKVAITKKKLGTHTQFLFRENLSLLKVFCCSLHIHKQYKLYITKLKSCTSQNHSPNQICPQLLFTRDSFSDSVENECQHEMHFPLFTYYLIEKMKLSDFTSGELYVLKLGQFNGVDDGLKKLGYLYYYSL